MKTHHTALLLLGFAPVLSLQTAAAQSWDKKFVDPHPLPDDLVLPMPCGGAMTFRPVDVPTGDNLLDDDAIILGRSDPQDGYNEFMRHAYVAAPFAVSQHPELRRYYLGKYDVTQNQAESLSGTCAPPTLDGQHPKTHISWDEAITFSTKYSTWLHTQKIPLPNHDGATSFVRLPTDDEWSYAARGGMHVSPTDFMAPTWPMPEGADQYIAAGPDLGGMQRVGQMKPNPLGLYDMLGEASQMMLEPYRLNRVGRLQGLAGGILVCGGNYLSNPDEITTSSRAEVPLYSPQTGEPTRLPEMGFRLVLATDAIGSLHGTEQAQNAFNTLMNKTLPASADAQTALAGLQKNTTDPATLNGLKLIQTAMASDSRARFDADRQALAAQIQALVALAADIWEVDHAIQLIQKSADILKSQPTPLTPAQTAQIANHLQARQTELGGAINGYISLLQAVTNSQALPDLSAITAQQADAIKALQDDRAIQFLMVTAQNIQSSHSGKLPTGQTIKSQIEAIH
ncbi:MAG: SUMF1/EgtB/PvdO family nonheme iron enzyme [Gluconobacter sp.]|uniref:formylglycine-generating enzyme family protein n=1 Tax=unclassified Gluconobacter TaxID=2644261 RepID=UPI001B8D7001|nr:SUMF1/EgtB/PvdO family nonheme iron enzyme [Gluconobacter sp. Dm-73]MBS1075704.1 SUMF1/EgtB/PvdO family nonheme iron enzyme [Gluconobacter sp. Dm-73]